LSSLAFASPQLWWRCHLGCWTAGFVAQGGWVNLGRSLGWSG